MTIRERTEAVERQLLSPRATFSDTARRDRPEEECPLRTAFQRDRDRILHSGFFRRMKHKTQVYIAPRGDHYRTRMTHTLEVAQIGRTMARALRLNEDLIEAMALGHDLGHTPFGHVGESALNDACGHFHHNEQSVRIVEVLDKGGQGLNLTREVRDGILHHTGAVRAASPEGQLLKYADRIAYLCHDFDDAEAAGLLTAEDLPDNVRRRFGETHSEMITAMVTDLIAGAMDSAVIRMSPRETRRSCSSGSSCSAGSTCRRRSSPTGNGAIRWCRCSTGTSWSTPRRFLPSGGSWPIRISRPRWTSSPG